MFMAEGPEVLEISSDEEGQPPGLCETEESVALVAPDELIGPPRIINSVPSKRRRVESRMEHKGDEDQVNDDNNDCLILDGDPDDKVQYRTVAAKDSDDLLIVGSKGELACRDFPHSRHNCSRFPFNSVPHERHCDMCHCYVCDILAPCLYWGNGSSLADHCHATDREKSWKIRRKCARHGCNVSAVLKPSEASPSKYYRARCPDRAVIPQVQRISGFRRGIVSSQRFNQNRRNEQQSARIISSQMNPVTVNVGHGTSYPAVTASHTKSKVAERRVPATRPPVVSPHVRAGCSIISVHSRGIDQDTGLRNSVTPSSPFTASCTMMVNPVAPGGAPNAVPCTGVGNWDSSGSIPFMTPCLRTGGTRTSICHYECSSSDICTRRCATNPDVLKKLQDVIAFLELDMNVSEDHSQPNESFSSCHSIAVSREAGSTNFFQPGANIPVTQTVLTNASSATSQSISNLQSFLTVDNILMPPVEGSTPANI